MQISFGVQYAREPHPILGCTLDTSKTIEVPCRVMALAMFGRCFCSTYPDGYTSLFITGVGGRLEGSKLVLYGKETFEFKELLSRVIEKAILENDTELTDLLEVFQ
jgi:hypothetical protein